MEPLSFSSPFVKDTAILQSQVPSFDDCLGWLQYLFEQIGALFNRIWNCLIGRVELYDESQKKRIQELEKKLKEIQSENGKLHSDLNDELTENDELKRAAVTNGITITSLRFMYKNLQKENEALRKKGQDN